MAPIKRVGIENGRMMRRFFGLELREAMDVGSGEEELTRQDMGSSRSAGRIFGRIG
jgi:hypothetical protein